MRSRKNKKRRIDAKSARSKGDCTHATYSTDHASESFRSTPRATHATSMQKMRGASICANERSLSCFAPAVNVRTAPSPNARFARSMNGATIDTFSPREIANEAECVFDRSRIRVALDRAQRTLLLEQKMRGASTCGTLVTVCFATANLHLEQNGSSAFSTDHVSESLSTARNARYF